MGNATEYKGDIKTDSTVMVSSEYYPLYSELIFN
jgi:hypothetical protein